jgi:hypothetical protein
MSIIEAPLLAMLAGYGSQCRPQEQEKLAREFESRRCPLYVCVDC